MRLAYRFGWIPFMATLLVMAVGIALGNWQSQRAVEKTDLGQSLAERAAAPLLEIRGQPEHPAAIEFRRVVVMGEFDASWPVYLDNRPYQGRAGFYLFMPLRIANSDQSVLVARGWIPRDTQQRTRLPVIAVPLGPVQIQGVARRTVGQVMKLGEEPPLKPGAIAQNLTLPDFARASGHALQAFIIEQTSDTGDTLVRDWPLPSTGADKHRGYAFQWYALAGTAFIFFLVTGFRRASKSDSSAS